MAVAGGREGRRGEEASPPVGDEAVVVTCAPPHVPTVDRGRVTVLEGTAGGDGAR